MNDREFDALVAEKVMEFEWLRWPLNPEQPSLVPPGITPPPASWWLGRSVYALVPRFSAEIAAAMQVVAHFTTEAGHGGCLHHFGMIYFAGEGQWCIEIGGRTCGKPGQAFRLPQDLWSESLQLAICRAALLAVGYSHLLQP